jgi:hypothetical protein
MKICSPHLLTPFAAPPQEFDRIRTVRDTEDAPPYAGRQSTEMPVSHGERPRGVILIALLFGLHSVVSGGLVAWTLWSVQSDPPIGFVILDLLIVSSSGLTAFGAWHLAEWTKNVLALWTVFMLATLWGHLLSSGFGIPIETYVVGAVGTAFWIALSLWMVRYLRDVARPAAGSTAQR